jgi:putative endonuclease
MYQVFDWLRHRARLRRWNPAHAWGRRGEDLAHRYLRSLGYTIVARNFRTRSGSGEVDLIGWDGEALAFIEVKTRATDEYGDPERAVDIQKRRKLLIAARDYTNHAMVKWERVRFDVVSVLMEHPPKVTLTKDAFGKTQVVAAGAL